jgi:hypothetical protein
MRMLGAERQAAAKGGTPNKRTLVLAAQAEAAVAVAAGEEPIDYMLRIMRDPTVEQSRRDAMAKAAAPYRRPQLQAVAHKHLNADGSPIVPTVNLTIMQPPEPKQPEQTEKVARADAATSDAIATGACAGLPNIGRLAVRVDSTSFTSAHDPNWPFNNASFGCRHHLSSYPEEPRGSPALKGVNRPDQG